MRFEAKDKAQLYHELTKLLQAGFSMEKSLETLDHHPLSEGSLHVVRSVAQHLREGTSIRDAFQNIDDIALTGVEENLIEAGERGGLLEDVFRHLADYYERVHEARRAVIRSLVYPAVLLHVAAFLPALPKLVRGDGASALWSSLGLLAIFYVIAAGVIAGYLFLQRQSTTSTGIDRFLSKIPILGKLRRMLAMERFAEVCRIYLLSAFKPSEAVAAAGRASQSGHLREQSASVSQDLASGQAMGPALLARRAFPRDFAAGMSTAEESGTLDQELQRWANLYASRVRESFAQVEVWLPKAVFLIIGLFVAWQIVQVYFGYLNVYDQLMEDLAGH